MILHLESGCCNCQLDSEGVTQLADECLGGEYEPGFRCEGCGSNFSRVSGLFQHVESDCCDRDGGVNEGALGRFLEHLELNI